MVSSRSQAALAALILAMLAPVSCRGPGTSLRPADLPNVVIVMLDTLRPDRLGFHGYGRETAPFLAELASRSAVFTNAVSTSSWTAPSTASLLTGRYSNGHGVVEGFVAHQARSKALAARGGATVPINRIASSVPTLTAVLRELGYRTFGLAANPNIGPELGFDRGFDEFVRFAAEPVDAGRSEHLVGARSFVSAGAERFLDQVRDWKVADAAPFFLYLHLNDVHIPYHKRAPWFEADASDASAAYDSEISYADSYIEKIVSELGLDDDAIIIVVSDHGEGFGEHGRVEHRQGLYSEIYRILMMINAPGRGVTAARHDFNVSLVDVLPTLLDLIGVSDAAETDGVSLAPLVRAGGDAALAARLRGRPVFGHRAATLQAGERHVWAVTQGDWKLVDEYGRLELYNVAVDRGEVLDLTRDEPEVVARMHALLEDFKAEYAARPMEQEGVILDEETLETLRSLGYTGAP